jgi:hypothetical protein
LAADNVVSIDSAKPAGDPAEFALFCLEPADGASVAIDDRVDGRRPLARDEFAAQFASLLSFAGKPPPGKDD